MLAAHSRRERTGYRGLPKFTKCLAAPRSAGVMFETARGVTTRYGGLMVLSVSPHGSRETPVRPIREREYWRPPEVEADEVPQELELALIAPTVTASSGTLD